MGRSIAAEMATIADASEAHLVTILTDSPASADALRDEAEATNVEIEVFLNALGVKINAILVVLETHGLVASA